MKSDTILLMQAYVHFKRLLDRTYTSHQDEFILLETTNENILFSFHFNFAASIIFAI